MIIVRLLSPGPWLLGTTKVYSGVGADIVMESITLTTRWRGLQFGEPDQQKSSKIVLLGPTNNLWLILQRYASEPFRTSEPHCRARTLALHTNYFRIAREIPITD
jgi:hypothetical protein